MKQFETKNYIFNYIEGSAAERDIEKIAAGQEACFAYICSVLQVEPGFRITYILCDTPEQVGEFYGDNVPCNGFASVPDKIYAVYNDQVKCVGFHEDVHLISYLLNRPFSAAVREGIAMFFDRKWWGISNQEWAEYYLKKGMFTGIREYLKDEVFFDIHCGISYPIAGCLTEYLIHTYGMEKYLAFWQWRGDMSLAMEEIFGVTADELDRDFREYLGLFRMDEAVETRIAELVAKKVEAV